MLSRIGAAALAIVLVGVATPSCSAFSSEIGTTDPGAVGAADADAGADSGAGGDDFTGAEPVDGRAGTDAAGAIDVAQTPIRAQGCGKNPGDGSFGGACLTGGDCASGLCLPTNCGRRCTVACVDECPLGWSCRLLSQPGQDPLLACLQDPTSLCLPCRSDADCAAEPGGSGDRCLNMGAEEGAFCGTACGDDDDCPEGFECGEALALQTGAAVRQCLLRSGECACSSYAIDVGAQTGCQPPQAVRGCHGARICTGTGLSACRPEEDPLDSDGDGDADCADPDDDNDGTCDGPESMAGICKTGPDCSPLDPAVHRDAPEVCNGIDDNCTGGADEAGAEGCTLWHLDLDGDGFAPVTPLQGQDPERCLCEAAFPYRALIAGDCNDTSADVHPGAAEQCNSVDDDCDGATDPDGSEGAVPWFIDGDDDGYGVSDDSATACHATPPYTAREGADCRDDRADIHPGAPEVCNEIDDDCDGVTDAPGSQGCTELFADADGDGYGSQSSRCLCAPEGDFKADKGGDCCDSDPDTRPGQGQFTAVLDACDSWDRDCDGTAELRWTGTGNCGNWPGCDADDGPVFQEGWQGSQPSCGEQGTWLYDCDAQFLPQCLEDTREQVQECR